METYGTDPDTEEQQLRLWQSHSGLSCGMQGRSDVTDHGPVTPSRYSALESVGTDSLARRGLMTPSESDERSQFGELNFHQHQHDTIASRAPACRLLGDREAPFDSHASLSTGSQFHVCSLPKRRCLGGIETTTNSKGHRFQTERSVRPKQSVSLSRKQTRSLLQNRDKETVSTYFGGARRDRQVPGTDLLHDDAYASEHSTVVPRSFVLLP